MFSFGLHPAPNLCLLIFLYMVHSPETSKCKYLNAHAFATQLRIYSLNVYHLREVVATTPRQHGR